MGTVRAWEGVNNWKDVCFVTGCILYLKGKTGTIYVQQSQVITDAILKACSWKEIKERVNMGLNIVMGVTYSSSDHATNTCIYMQIYLNRYNFSISK